MFFKKFGGTAVPHATTLEPPLSYSIYVERDSIHIVFM